MFYITIIIVLCLALGLSELGRLRVWASVGSLEDKLYRCYLALDNADQFATRLRTLFLSFDGLPVDQIEKHVKEEITKLKVTENTLDFEYNLLISATDFIVTKNPEMKKKLEFLISSKLSVVRKKAKEAKNTTELVDFLMEQLND